MDGDDFPLGTKVGHPSTFGWLRRPERDTPTQQTWERPDGKFVYFRHNRRPVVVRFPKKPKALPR